MIRNIEESDITELRRIHSEYFAEEFSFDDFLLNSMYNCIITNDASGEIITAGSIRYIAEMVAITNPEQSVRIRRTALYELLQIASFVLRKTNTRQLHAFVQDDKWENQLIRSGFKQTKGTALYINI